MNNVVTKMPALIGLVGNKGAGKSSVGNILAYHYNYNQVAFADPLKAMLIEVNPRLDGDYLNNIIRAEGWDKAKNERASVRRAMQVLGSAVRSLDEDYWVRIGESSISWKQAGRRAVVVTDVRYENEAQAIRSAGGMLWRVVRPGYDGDGHESEAGQAAIIVSQVVHNDGSYTDLDDEVRIRMDHAHDVFTDMSFITVAKGVGL